MSAVRVPPVPYPSVPVPVSLPSLRVVLTIDVDSEIGDDFLRYWGEYMADLAADGEPMTLPSGEDFRKYVAELYEADPTFSEFTVELEGDG